MGRGKEQNQRLEAAIRVVPLNLLGSHLEDRPGFDAMALEVHPVEPLSFGHHQQMEEADAVGSEDRVVRQNLGAKLRNLEHPQLHHVIGEGNFVLTTSEGLFGDQAMAFYDLFRVADGKIVEHWDVIAPMPGDDAPHNDDGKF